MIGDRNERLNAERVDFHEQTTSIREINSFYVNRAGAHTGLVQRFVQAKTMGKDLTVPHISTRSTTGNSNGKSGPDAGRAWEALQRHLQTRIRALNDEVAHYPRPIARCDVQLSKLLEQRARLYRSLERIGAIGGAPPTESVGAWLRRVDEFVRTPEPECEDETEIALRADLAEATAAATRS
jgi:hypothetical protein